MDHHFSSLLTEFSDVFTIPKKYPGTSEIILTGNDCVFIENKGELLPLPWMIQEHRRKALIYDVAGSLGKIITEENPFISTNLPFFNESRFSALIPPVSHFDITIRIANQKEVTLEDLNDSLTITSEELSFLKNAVLEKKNILIAGGTGSGKTTLAKALAYEIKDDRLIVIEDTREITSPNKNTSFFTSSPHLSLHDCVKASLRMRPDRIILGELRDGTSSLELLKAWNTGHPGGIATVHANNADDALKKILLFLHEVMKNPTSEMLNVIDIVVFIERVVLSGGTKRVVTQIKELKKSKNRRISA